MLPDLAGTARVHLVALELDAAAVGKRREPVSRGVLVHAHGLLAAALNGGKSAVAIRQGPPPRGRAERCTVGAGRCQEDQRCGPAAGRAEADSHEQVVRTGFSFIGCSRGCARGRASAWP